MTHIKHDVPNSAALGLAGINEDGARQSADERRTINQMNELVELASHIRVGNALVAKLGASRHEDEKTLRRMSAVIEFLRSLDRIDRC